MRPDKIFAAIAIVGAAASASAQPDGAIVDSMLGKVKTVYVRESRSLYIEKNLLRKTTGKELWVDARAATELAAAPVGELFKVPANVAIERGDLVTAQFADPATGLWNLIPEVNRVTLLVARHDTLRAMAFGPNSKSAPALLIQLQASYSPAE